MAYRRGCKAVAFAPDGKIFASAGVDGVIRLFEAGAGKEVHAAVGHQDGVEAVAFAATGKTLATASHDRTVRLWDAATAKEMRTFRGHYAEARSVAFSPDGTKLASAGGDWKAYMWDVESGKKLRDLECERELDCVVFSPDGKSLLGGGFVEGNIWDVATGKGRTPFPFQASAMYSAAWSSDGKILASAGGYHGVQVRDPANGKTLQSFDPLDHRPPDENRLVFVIGGGDGKPWANAVALHPTGTILAAGASDGWIILWDIATGKLRKEWPAHDGEVSSVAFSPDGRMLASGGRDGLVCLWEVASGKERRVFRGHIGAITSVAFSPGRKTLASASSDTTILIWAVIP
jgi:WD40 repeat protein